MTYCHLSSRSDAMYLKSILLFKLIVLTIANPFHKYPYVFLLDVGNEELENTCKEQIRVSSPGGSLALRYPAMGNGETLTHVRVSGIDFGTDLKSNIVDGGPGYKYVVLVFIGNPGVPYDAVVTIQTLPVDGTDVDGYVDNSTVGTGDITENFIEEDVGNLETQAEESVPSGESSKNTELSLQPSSKIYIYTQNQNVDKQGYDSEQIEDDRDYEEQDVETSKGVKYRKKESDGEQEESANQDNVIAYRHYGADQVQHQNENRYVSNQKYDGNQTPNNDDSDQYTADQLHKIQNNFGESRQSFIEQEQSRDYQHSNEGDPSQNENQDSYDSEQQQNENGSPQSKQYIGNSAAEDESYDGEAPANEADNNYRNYDALKALLYGYNGVLPEETAGDAEQNPEAGSSQENEELDQIFNDEEVHNDLDRDLNNNQFDRDDGSAVAS